MNKRKLGALLLALLLSALLLMPQALASMTKYVYKSNGKTITVYDKPNGKKIGELASGTQVEVEATSGTFTRIAYGRSSAFVRSYNVVNRKPAKAPKATPTPSPAPQHYDQYYYSLQSMNMEFRSMRQTTEYDVYVRPDRPTGYVNFRFAPSLEAEIIAQLYQGHRLSVIARGSAWLQVRDPASGRVGYIMQRYTTAY